MARHTAAALEVVDYRSLQAMCKEEGVSAKG
jgi:hypothetical protein